MNTQDYTSSGSSYSSHSSGGGGCGGGSVVVYLFEKCKRMLELAGLASLFYKTGAQHALRLCQNCHFHNPKQRIALCSLSKSTCILCALCQNPRDLFQFWPLHRSMIAAHHSATEFP